MTNLRTIESVDLQNVTGGSKQIVDSCYFKASSDTRKQFPGFTNPFSALERSDAKALWNSQYIICNNNRSPLDRE